MLGSVLHNMTSYDVTPVCMYVYRSWSYLLQLNSMKVYTNPYSNKIQGTILLLLSKANNKI